MKIIKFAIVLSLILGSLSLDMSSTKRRTTTSAYVALYTSLGFEYGFKDQSESDSTKVKKYYFYIDNKNIGEKDLNEQIQFFVDDGIIFNLTAMMRSKLPIWFTKFCDAQNNCKFPYSEVSMFRIGYNPNWTHQGFQVEINGKNTFMAVIANSEISTSEIDMLKVYYTSKSNACQKKFTDKITAAHTQLSNLLTILKSHDDVGNLKYQESQKTSFKKAHAKAISEQQELIKEIKNLSMEITKRSQKIKLTTTERKNCEEEKMNLKQEISKEEIVVKNEEAKKAKHISELKKSRNKAEQTLFYWCEASYFNRVFSERIIKSEEDVRNALNDVNAKTFMTKITQAFAPVTVIFAGNEKK